MVQTDRKHPVPQLYSHALLAFYHHGEMKYPGGDKAGLLGRWTIHAPSEPHYLGKEVERKRQAGDNLADILMEPPLEYKPRRHRSMVTTKPLHPAVIEKLKDHFSIRKLAKKAKLAANTVAGALRGQPILPRSWRLLMRVYEHMQLACAALLPNSGSPRSDSCGEAGSLPGSCNSLTERSK